MRDREVRTIPVIARRALNPAAPLQIIKRTGHPLSALLHHVRIDHGRGHIVVSEQVLDCPDIRPTLQKMSSKTVSKRVAGNVFGNPASRYGRLNRLLHRSLVQVVPPHEIVEG